MPSFPQHRNLKNKQPPQQELAPVLDQTSQLPAISDIVSPNYLKKIQMPLWLVPTFIVAMAGIQGS